MLKSNLQKFIEKNSVKDKNFTHTTISTPKRKFNVSENQLEEFYKLYIQEIESGKFVSITEKTPELCPVIVDLDFRYKMKNIMYGAQREYTADIVRKVIECFHNTFEEVFDVIDAKAYRCVVLEKDAPRLDDNCIKDGLHLHFPYIVCEKWIQSKIIRKKVIEQIKEKDIFGEMDLINNIENIYDKNVPSNNWLMFMSGKDRNGLVYRITKCYDQHFNTMKPNDFFRDMPHPEYHIARQLSVNSDVEPLPVRQDISCQKLELEKKEVKPILTKNYDLIVEDINTAKMLIEYLPPDLSDDYNDWFKVGVYLYNISQGIQPGLQLWIDFSRQSPKFKPGECEMMWDNFKIEGIDLKQLSYYIKEKNPEGYQEFSRYQKLNHVKGALRCRHGDIAGLLYIFFGDDYKIVNIKNKVWYKFDKHRWITDEEGISLKCKIRTEVLKEFVNYMGTVQHRMLELNTEYAGNQDEVPQHEMEELKNQMKCIQKALDKFHDTTFKKNVMNECIEHFYDGEFIKKMDEDPNLLVFNNGVFDCKIKEFRPGRPSDYCTKSTNIDYIGPVPDDNPLKQYLISTLRKTFTNNNLYEFFKQTVADFVIGGNRHKIFLIWTGKGNNGKSFLAELISRAFGDYLYSPPTSLITTKQKNSSNATPELVPLKGCRIAELSETDTGDKLNGTMMKKLTSNGDRITGRDLFKGMIQIKTTFVTLLHCNFPPEVNSNDPAAWNRIRNVQFESKFVSQNSSELPETEEEQYRKKIFPIDTSLKDKLDELAPIFMSMMIEWYKEYHSLPLYEPEEVLNATKEYRLKNDFYQQFIDERLETAKNQRLVATNVYEDFKNWFSKSNPGKRVPNRSEFQDCISKKVKFRNAVFYDVQFKQQKLEMEIEDNGSDIENDLEDFDF